MMFILLCFLFVMTLSVINLMIGFFVVFNITPPLYFFKHLHEFKIAVFLVQHISMVSILALLLVFFSFIIFV